MITLKFKYTSDKAVNAIAEDIRFAGGKITEKTKLLSNKLIYFKVEADNNFTSKFRETRSSKFQLN